MNDTQIKTLDQVRQFLEGTRVIDLVIDAKEDRYAWIQHTLIRFRYRQLSKADKGLLLGFLQNKHGVKQTRRQVLHYNITPLPYAHAIRSCHTLIISHCSAHRASTRSESTVQT